MLKHIILLLLAAFGLSASALSQCQVYDSNGDLAAIPYWYACNGGDYTLNLYSPTDWADYTINWGDGSALEVGTNWNSPTFISHVYTATIQNFDVVITNPTLGCSISGVLVMEEATNPSIVIPTGVLTQACAPHAVIFSNQSSNVSENTVFTWDFGDGSAPLVLDHTNAGQTISHTYLENTVDCLTEVNLYAENYCNTIQGGAFFNTFSPIQIYDTDDASITASSTVLCFPANEVEYTNSTEMNCEPQGNTFQRQEYWNFGDYWGTGQDSIVDWTPWPPTFPYTIQYPGNLGDTYEVMLVDSNLCGLDTTYMTVSIVAPPVADVILSETEICEGESIELQLNHTGNYNTQSLNLGNGTGWIDATGWGGSVFEINYPYLGPGTYTVGAAIGIENSAACADTAFVTIDVIPTPDISILADESDGCDSVLVTFTESSTNTDAWEWEFGNGETYSGNDPPPQNYDSEGDYVVTLNASNTTGCLANVQQNITVYNSPQVAFLADNVCVGTNGSFTDMSTSDPGDPIITWYWEFGDGDFSIDQNPMHQYTVSGDYTVSLTVSTLHCSSTYSDDITVEVAPEPIFIPTPDNGCAPLDVEFENNSTNAVSYTWDFGDEQGSSEDEPEHTFYNFSNQDTTYNVVLTAISTFGCYQSDSLNIVVSPGAQASFIDDAQPPGCAPWTSNFTNTSFGASSYLWDFGDGSPTSTEVSPDHLFTNTTGFIQTFDVQLIAYSLNGCNDTVMSVLTVFPEPDFSFDITPNSGCTPLLTQMPLISSGQSFDWDFGDGQSSLIPNPTHLYENNTDAPVTYTVTLNAVTAFGCAGSSTSDITVFPAPEANFAVSDFSGCSPLTIDITDLSVGAVSGMYDFGDGDTTAYAGSTQHTFTNTTSSNQSFTITQTIENADGCLNTFTQSIEVSPSAVAGIVVPDPGCSPYNVALVNSSTGATGFQWDFGNGQGSTQTNGTTTYINNSGVDSVYNVTLLAISANGCNDMAEAEVTVHGIPDAFFTTDVNDGCSVVAVEFTNSSVGGISYFWDYGDTDTSSTAEPVHFHSFENITDQPIEYAVTLTVINDLGCEDIYTVPITVYPEITAAFELDENGCAPLSVTFDNESFGGGENHFWDFGDGGTSSFSNPTHVFLNDNPTDTTYTVELTTTSQYGCQDVITQDITVFAAPVIDLVILESEGCYPLEVTFGNASTGAESYSWVYGTGEVGNTDDLEHTHTFFNLQSIPVTYEVTLNGTSDNGCFSSDNVFVEVQPQLIADFESPTEGCTPFIAQFENTSTGALQYQWDFGDGSPVEDQFHVTHLFTNDTDEPVTYTVTLTTESYVGCTDVHTAEITVYPTPVAQFMATPETQVFPNATVAIDNLSTGGSSVDYTWNMGDGSQLIFEEEPGDYTFSTWGNYNISLQADNGACSDAAQINVEILPPSPTVAFEGPAQGCAPVTVSFENLSEYGASFVWDFGDGGFAFVADPVYTYNIPGTYSVKLTVTGHDGGVIELIREEIIEVYPSANAAFAATPDEVEIPYQQLYLVNLSTGADEYLWDFGDGNTSTAESPEHFYQQAGVYSISLYVNNEYNCPDSITVPEIVTAISLGDIIFPNAFTPIEGGSGGQYDPQSFDNNVFFPIQSGVEDYRLQIFNRWGELLFESTDVMIGWDGMYRGQLCKQDVYVWKAEVKFSDGAELTSSGDVTLLR
ncbi:MAG: PKD domain-containing protein [Flavobacteriales bacterium]